MAHTFDEWLATGADGSGGEGENESGGERETGIGRGPRSPNEFFLPFCLSPSTTLVFARPRRSRPTAGRVLISQHRREFRPIVRQRQKCPVGYGIGRGDFMRIQIARAWLLAAALAAAGCGQPPQP